MITVILTAYNRPETLKAQIASIENQTIKPKEIWIWYNKGDKEQIKIENKNIKVIYASHNFKFHGRFSLALLAQTEYIAIFDDDCLPQPKWFENCIDTIKKCNGILGTSGVTLLGTKYKPNKKYGWTSNHNESTVQVDLVGHNWFFKKEWLKYMWMEEPVSWENGEDIQFSALCQKYGNINTYVPPHPIKDKSLWGNNIEHATKWGNDKNATHLHEKNHYSLRDSICEAYIKKGWKTINSK
jgi:glycosyltransferase involved in cell wall biosynthesis